LNALLPSRVAAGMIYVIRFAIFVHFKTQGGQTGIMENNMSLTPVFPLFHQASAFGIATFGKIKATPFDQLNQQALAQKSIK